MKSMSSRRGGIVAMAGLMLSVGSSAHAVTLMTPPVAPPPGGYVNCKVTATSPTPIGIVAVIMSVNGTNITDFGTSFRASPAATGDGLYYAEETAGSLHQQAGYCKATVNGARRRDAQVTLTAYDANQVEVQSVEAR